MERFINWPILREPLNWIIVGIMLLIGFSILHIIIHPGAALIPQDSGTATFPQ